MKDNHYSITKDDFYTLLSKLSKEADVYIPVRERESLYYKRFDPDYKGEYIADRVRAAEPIKSFLTGSREKVDKFPPEDRPKKQVLAGVKNCDITSLKIQDFVFKDTDPKDPFYIQRRENATIISCDCNLLWESCFCVALGLTPYPEEGFDLNLSKEVDGFLAEVGSDKGRELVDKNKDLFSKAADSQVKDKAKDRKSFMDKLLSQVKKAGVPFKDKITGSVKKSFGIADIWTEFASTCIECGGCNHCCPACHCFFLSDQKKDGLKARYKSWDACLYNRYARVAGGANPRKHLFERLRNRFDKKFEFFPNVLGTFGCTGCGRCTEACPGKIDIREVLRRVVKGS